MPSARFSGSFPGIRPDYRQVIKDELEEVMRLAVKKFVHAASERIPSLSGMARGSLSPLADYVGTQLKGGPDPRSGPPPKGQSHTRGRALSSFLVTHNRFEWSSDVPYFSRHNRNEWQIQRHAIKAFIDEYHEQIIQADIPSKMIHSVVIKGTFNA